jgi:carbon-monoxide dehydrogenase large subunit
VRWVGDYVAFVVAETRHQAADAAELIAVDYEPLPARRRHRCGDGARRAAVWDDRPDNICFVHEVGDNAAAEAALAARAHRQAAASWSTG